MSRQTLRIAQLMLTIRPGGGAESLVLTFAKAAAQYPIELHVLALRKQATSLQPQLEATGANVVYFPGAHLTNARRFWRLLRYLRRHKIDIIHTHLTGANILGLLAGRLLRIPVVVTLHNVHMRSQQHYIHGHIETSMLNRFASKVVAVGWQTAAAHQKRLTDLEIEVIPNAVTITRPGPNHKASQLRASLMKNPQNRLLLAVGRLEKQKAHNELILAIQLLLKNCSNVELLIAGAGPLREQLQQQIINAGLEQHVQLLGLRRDIENLMQVADLFVSAAHWEGLPVAILEAMAAGLPLVITNVGDVGNVVDETMARLIAPGEPPEIARTIADALKHPEEMRQMAMVAQAHVFEQFNAAKWATSIITLYHQILSMPVDYPYVS